ncbi:MAG: hypothetical protein HOL22_05725 [Euryarchaeota archaeon]|jgi:hypothetical protein|nr:hypothetical protein [Euryarchaeota archaeon]MBT5595393.1 hypothetical protein [Euryarchaeota archaeon]MBT5843352.1 hypothetical protein [Euryarchaeota archaeon]MBT6640285.1 hypothetical protein [Euryarchaeota archaeon]MBT6844951.1 hypothetical protein [Euryarchaeota archaeon]
MSPEQKPLPTKSEPGFFSKWFGFSGWRAMSAKARIFTQITYRVFFLLGLGALIIGYGLITDSDPGGLPLIGMIVGWFFIFQAMVNFIFVEGSR